VGILVVKKGFRRAYPIFGTKTFGSMTLIATLDIAGFLGWASYISDKILGYHTTTTTFLISWIITGLVIHITGWVFFGRKSR
jgi:hypothetical protein